MPSPESNTTFNFQEGYCADFVLALHRFLSSKDTCFAVLRGACKRGQVLIHCYLYSGEHDSYLDSINYPNGTTIDEVEDRLDQWREIEQLEDPNAETWLDYFEFRDFLREIKRCRYRPDPKVQEVALQKIRQNH